MHLMCSRPKTSHSYVLVLVMVLHVLLAKGKTEEEGEKGEMKQEQLIRTPNEAVVALNA